MILDFERFKHRIGHTAERDTKLYKTEDNLWFKDYKVVASHEDFYDCGVSGVNEGRMTQ